MFTRAPMLVYWEATRACPLACQRCRAEAVPFRDPSELTTREVQGLLRQVAWFGGERPPHVVITGGDPLQRPDVFELIAYGQEQGLSLSITPAGTSGLTDDMIRRLKTAGISTLALSLDGSSASRHDTLRGVRGSFQWTVDAARTAVAEGLPLQINTLVTAGTADDLPATAEVVRGLGATRWALFFLIPVGRGRVLAEVTPQRSEQILVWLCHQAASPATGCVIKTTEAHHFRRIALLMMRAAGMDEAAIFRSSVGRGFGVRDGNGIVFVSHTGEIFPSGFLPIAAGNVRRDSLADIYRRSPLFEALRDVDRLRGKCGACEFRAICGGSRARAYARTHDPLGSDPLCPYVPRGGVETDVPPQ